MLSSALASAPPEATVPEPTTSLVESVAPSRRCWRPRDGERPRLAPTGGGLPVVRIGGVPAQVVMASSARIAAVVPRRSRAGVTRSPWTAPAAAQTSTLARPWWAGCTRWTTPRSARTKRSTQRSAARAGSACPCRCSVSRGRREGAVPLRRHQCDVHGVRPRRRALRYQPYDGTVRKVQPDGTSEIVAHDLGVACGIAFGSDGTMFVGDRSGTVFRIGSSAHVVPFVSLAAEPGGVPPGDGPRRRAVRHGPHHGDVRPRVPGRSHGAVSVMSSEFGRPQGLSVDEAGRPLRGGRGWGTARALPRAPRRGARAGRCRRVPGGRRHRRTAGSSGGLQRHHLPLENGEALESLMKQPVRRQVVDRIVGDDRGTLPAI